MTQRRCPSGALSEAVVSGIRTPWPRRTRASIILTSNKHVRDWPETFAGDEILTTAIPDRLLHHVHIVHIDGRSYQLRELDGLLRPEAVAPPNPGKKG